MEELCGQRVNEKIPVCFPEIKENVESVFLTNNKDKRQNFNSFEKKKFSPSHIAKKILILKKLYWYGPESNVESLINLIIWRRFAKTKEPIGITTQSC